MQYKLYTSTTFSEPLRFNIEDVPYPNVSVSGAVAGEGNRDSIEEEAATAVTARDVYSEIEEAKDKTFLLGVKLKLPEDKRREIVSKKMEKEDRLLQTIDEYLKLKEYRPDWREMAGALKEVKLDKLAEKIEKAHCTAEPVITHGKIIDTVTLCIFSYG